jgi:hypothetical protein
VTLLPLVVVLIFAAALVALYAWTPRSDARARPVVHRREEQSLHHHRNCPGPGAD